MSKLKEKIRNSRIIRNINRVLFLFLPFYNNKLLKQKLSERPDFVEDEILITNSSSKVVQTGSNTLQNDNTKKRQVSKNNHEIRAERVELPREFESVLEFEAFRNNKGNTITILTGSGYILTNDERPLSLILKDLKSRPHISPTDLRRLNDNFTDF